MPDCPKHCPIVLTIFNIASALLLIGFGIAGIVMQTMNNLTSGKFFLLFSPIFMILVGGLFIAAQFKLDFIMKHFVFMKQYFGRGVFNLFMASSVFYYFACGSDDNTVVAWIAAILIFVTGVFYIVLGCCCSSGQDETAAAEEELIK